MKQQEEFNCEKCGATISCSEISNQIAEDIINIGEIECDECGEPTGFASYRTIHIYNEESEKTIYKRDLFY